MPDIVFFNGSYLDRDQVRISPDDRGFLFADGIYEVVRFYGGRPFELQAHLARMVDGLRSLRIEGVEAGTIETVVSELRDRNGLSDSDALLYLQITRGVAPRVHHFPDEKTEPTVFASIRAFSPSVDPTVGAAVITAPDHRWTRCDIKSVALLPNCMASQDAHEAGAIEAVLVRDGVALEGTRSSCSRLKWGRLPVASEAVSARAARPGDHDGSRDSSRRERRSDVSVATHLSRGRCRPEEC